MKELWIHLGMPKTGSSALQVFFAQKADMLKKEGIDYIELSDFGDAKKGQISSGNGALLARSLLPNTHEAHYSDTEGLYSKLFNMVKKSKSEKILISSEFFAVIPVKQYEKLLSDMLNIEVQLKVIFYVRRQDQFLMSSYMQRVKRHGLTATPDEYVLENYKKIYFLKYFGYTRLFEDAVGHENLFPRIFELTKDHPQGIVGHFMESVLGYVPNWLEPVASVNISPSPAELKFMLAANKFAPRIFFSDYLNMDSISSGRSTHQIKHSLISSHIVEEVTEYFDDQNKKFFNQYLKGEKFPDFDTSSNDSDFSNYKVSAGDVLEIVVGFLVRFDRRITEMERRIRGDK